MLPIFWLESADNDLAAIIEYIGRRCKNSQLSPPLAH
ncbi:hypothetical protein CFBP6109_P100047 (plasmid) [Pseudomonas syringae pv. cerasicola]|nr:hypothetical protein CFBP6109_P100047 [Pseudomonas syringae pv. cerasicola]